MGALAREGGNKIRNLRRGESQCPSSSDTLFSNSLARALLPPWELRHGPPATDDGGLLLLLSSTAHASKQVHSRDSLFSLFLPQNFLPQAPTTSPTPSPPPSAPRPSPSGRPSSSPSSSSSRARSCSAARPVSSCLEFLSFSLSTMFLFLPLSQLLLPLLFPLHFPAFSPSQRTSSRERSPTSATLTVPRRSTPTE